VKGIRIVSDGSIFSTKVYIIDKDGEIATDISSITKAVHWSCDAADSMPQVTLEVISENIEVIGQLQDMVIEDITHEQVEE